MGLFDYVKVESPVPDPEHQNDRFQSYSLECTMSRYTITAAGHLIHHRVRYERAKAEGASNIGTPRQTDPFSRFGELLKVAEEWDEEVPLHEDIFLNGDGVVYVARFTEGRLRWIKRTADAPEAAVNRPWR